MNANEEPWYRVLRYWQDERGKTGLSLSLLVGATRNPIGSTFSSEDEAKRYSERLYCEMAAAKTPCGRRVSTYACPGIIGGIGLQLDPDDMEGENKPFGELWKFYGKAISRGKYSVCLGEFYEFNDNERKWMAEALSH